MALIQCPECGKEISDKAVACPKCGCPVDVIQKDTTPPPQISNYNQSLNKSNTVQKPSNSLLDQFEKAVSDKFQPIIDDVFDCISKNIIQCIIIGVVTFFILVISILMLGTYQTYGDFNLELFNKYLHSGSETTEITPKPITTIEPTPVVTPTPPPSPTPTVEPVKELTEEEYKAQCVEMYNDDFFKNEPPVGQYVKFNGFISGEYVYTSISTLGIIIDDITDKYNLRKEYLGCCVLHEETKNNAIPSYFGKSTNLMFPSTSNLSPDNYKAGQYVVVYGEIVQTRNGIFIIPKYIEE